MEFPAETQADGGGRIVEFLIAFLGSTVVLVLIATPVLVMARRRKKNAIVRNFLIGAGVISVLIAATLAGSTRITELCRAAGNPIYDCLDPGAEGLIILLVGGYVLATAVRAIKLRDE